MSGGLVIVEERISMAYIEDPLFGLWCEGQVEALPIGELPVKHQQDLIFWVVLPRRSKGFRLI